MPFIQLNDLYETVVKALILDEANYLSMKTWERTCKESPSLVSFCLLLEKESECKCSLDLQLSVFICLFSLGIFPVVPGIL